MSPPTQFAQHFAAKAAKVDAGEPSTTKWNGVRDLVAEELGVRPEDVYVSSISKPGNVTVRLDQSKNARGASVLVAMHTDSPATLRGTVGRTESVASARGAVAFVAADGGTGWAIEAIIAPIGSPHPATIGSSYPSALLIQF